VRGALTPGERARGGLAGRRPEVSATSTRGPVVVPDQPLITGPRHMRADELPAWIGASLGRLEEAARDCGGVTGAPFVAYHADVSMESDGPAEACVPVADEAAAREWAARRGAPRGAAVRVEPARRLARTRITKEIGRAH